VKVKKAISVKRGRYPLVWTPYHGEWVCYIRHLAKCIGCNTKTLVEKAKELPSLTRAIPHPHLDDIKKLLAIDIGIYPSVVNFCTLGFLKKLSDGWVSEAHNENAEETYKLSRKAIKLQGPLEQPKPRVAPKPKPEPKQLELSSASELDAPVSLVLSKYGFLKRVARMEAALIAMARELGTQKIVDYLEYRIDDLGAL